MLLLLRCTRDAGALELAGESRNGRVGIIDAILRCTTCAAQFPIENGIARLMPDELTFEDSHEMSIRDGDQNNVQPKPFIPPAQGWRSKLGDLLEIPPHLEELDPRNRRILEIGCGDGRFTMLMAQMGAQILAVDFSLGALRQLAWRLPSGIAPTAYELADRTPATDLRGRVGLVQADASRLHVASRSFDRAFATTPLDTQEQRMAMYRTIADALTDEGRYVGSVEHDDLNRRLLGLPLGRRYSKGGIFIEHFDFATIRREVVPFFGKLHFRLIRPRVPLLAKAPLSWAVCAGRAVTAVPVLRHFAEIQLLRAERPVRPPLEGEYRPGNSVAKGLFRWYKRRAGEEPMWDNNERV